MITQSELEALLEGLARNQNVTLGVGDPSRPDWYRAEVVSHDASSGLPDRHLPHGPRHGSSARAG